MSNKAATGEIDGMNQTPPDIPVIDHIAPLTAAYSAWFCDVWGVVHNGITPHDSAVQACQAFRDRGGVVVLLSNSPRHGDGVAAQLDRIGVPRSAYDTLVTSGDVARALMLRRGGDKVFLLGPERDRPMLDGLDIQLVGPDEAEVVLCSGLFDDETETPEDYTDLFTRLRARSLPMICANPDLMVERGDRLVYCAGALAARYGEMGGEVVYTGKPHPPIYDLARERLHALAGAVPDSNILAIGDGVKTDIAGAIAEGLDAVFVASGLHVRDMDASDALDGAAIAELFAGSPTKPVAAMKRLAW
ncbi:MAG: TIGR01459 family HAD-type hydrolase [Dichotomicrobium sp.]